MDFTGATKQITLAPNEEVAGAVNGVRQEGTLTMIVGEASAALPPHIYDWKHGWKKRLVTGRAGCTSTSRW